MFGRRCGRVCAGPTIVYTDESQISADRQHGNTALLRRLLLRQRRRTLLQSWVGFYSTGDVGTLSNAPHLDTFVRACSQQHSGVRSNTQVDARPLFLIIQRRDLLAKKSSTSFPCLSSPLRGELLMRPPDPLYVPLFLEHSRKDGTTWCGPPLARKKSWHSESDRSRALPGPPQPRCPRGHTNPLKKNI